ncbi:MAG TPA: GNAT family N-acetyltransferase [Solirubrobacteraceae bacterium]|jgi:ribosomal protein S18 acetylase RimI-like enzyme|nr:GNAT family N-acetyltransferase [Solirubrobacteraceae bacterium]
MSEIAEPLRPARILLAPKKYPPLRDFSCGRKGSFSEKLVNDCVRNLYLGRETLAQTLIVLEDANGKLIGVCSFYPHALGRLMGDAQRIHVVGVDRRYQGKRLKDGLRPGDVLLRSALEQIELTCVRMPYVSTLVYPENDRSRALFARHGFRELPYSGEGSIRYLRAPHKQLPILTLRPTVAVRRIVQRMKSTSRVVEVGNDLPVGEGSRAGEARSGSSTGEAVDLESLG